MIAALLWRAAPWLLAVAALAGLGLALHADGVTRGAMGERGTSASANAARAAAVEAAIANRMRDNSAQQAANDKANIEGSKRHETADKAVIDERNRLRADVLRAGGLRVPAPACPASGGPAAASQALADGGPAAPSAGTVAFPKDVEEGLLALVAEADALIEQARAMQQRLLEDARPEPPPE